MVGTCTAHWTLLTRGMAVMVGFLLLLWGGLGNAAEAPSEILIGATLPLSGRFTPMAGTFDRLCYSWAKLMNAQGGIYVKAYDKKLPVKFIIYDDKSELGMGGIGHLVEQAKMAGIKVKQVRLPNWKEEKQSSSRTESQTDRVGAEAKLPEPQQPAALKNALGRNSTALARVNGASR